LLHEDVIPWQHVAISGWILDPDRKKMSKSKGTVLTPIPLLEEYTADGVRYWAANARLGVDTAFDEQVFRVGKRLVTKLFNAGKFVLSQTAEIHPITSELDRAFALELRRLVERTTESFEGFDHARVLMETESFFWNRFTDTYIELTKTRAREDGEEGAAGRGSAVAALRLGLNVLLRLLAPMLPYITEEIWSWIFAGETNHPSIHRAPWPVPEEFAGIEQPADPESFEAAVVCLTALNKAKADAEVSVGREILELELGASAPTLERLKPVLDDTLAAARCQHAQLEKAEVEEGVILVRRVRFAERS
jgi:valyl-tRNA synthetase